VRAIKRTGDVVVASIHWGSNWGYGVPSKQRAFAHALIEDAGIDLVHGHSSHHAKSIEVYRGRLILYGCGDFLNDYEGIAGHESFRGDLAVAYLPELSAASGDLVHLEMVPFQIRNFRLNRPSPDDVEWLAATLCRESERFGVRVELGGDGAMIIRWH
jgi:poly-gamma-glutamate synthesis protein (capsule biosynthesis protein)